MERTLTISGIKKIIHETDFDPVDEKDFNCQRNKDVEYFTYRYTKATP